jgi:hypothetical protein
MTNAACLIANDSPDPAGVDFDTYVGYDPRRDLIATAPCAVPVYWLSLFNTSHLVTLRVAGDEGHVTVPSLVAEMPDAKRLLRERRAILAEFFPEFQPTWDRFARVVERLKSQYIKVELQELWDLEPEEFTPKIEAALRWFDSISDNNIKQILDMASIRGYERSERTISRVGEGVPRAFHLRGYSCKKSYWDNKSDL